MLLHCWWECKLIQPLQKVVCRFFTKQLGIKPPYDPAISLLCIYPEETKIEKDTCIPLFLAALFTIARTQMSINRCMDKEVVVHIHNGILLSHKRNAFESVLMRWMKAEPMIQSEVSQKEKDKYCILTHKYGINKNGTEEFICRATMEKQPQRIDLWTWGEGRRG